MSNPRTNTKRLIKTIPKEETTGMERIRVPNSASQLQQNQSDIGPNSRRQPSELPRNLRQNVDMSVSRVTRAPKPPPRQSLDLGDNSMNSRRQSTDLGDNSMNSRRQSTDPGENSGRQLTESAHSLQFDVDSAKINRNLSAIMSKYIPKKNTQNLENSDIDENETWVDPEEIDFDENETDISEVDLQPVAIVNSELQSSRNKFPRSTENSDPDDFEEHIQVVPKQNPKSDLIIDLRERVNIFSESIADMTHILGQLVAAQRDLTNAIQKLTDDVHDLNEY
jgi:hypothetical protein